MTPSASGERRARTRWQSPNGTRRSRALGTSQRSCICNIAVREALLTGKSKKGQLLDELALPDLVSLVSEMVMDLDLEVNDMVQEEEKNNDQQEAQYAAIRCLYSALDCKKVSIKTQARSTRSLRHFKSSMKTSSDLSSSLRRLALWPVVSA